MAISSGSPTNTKYFGLSTDQKPPHRVPFAARFYETDTGHTYLWTGQPGVGWVEYLGVTDPAGFFT